MTGVQRGDVGGGDIGLLGKFGVEPVHRSGAGPTIHPIDQAQRPHIFRAQRLFVREAELLHRLDGQARHVDFDDPVFFETLAAVQRITIVAGFRQVAGGKRAGVGDDDAAGFDVGQVGDQGRRVHHHQNVQIVARCHDLARAEINLKRRYPKCRSGRRSNFGREIGERCQVVAGQRRGQRKLCAG